MAYTDKEIEAMFERGKTYTIDGVVYRIKGFARWWKHFHDGTVTQYDICLYLLPMIEYESFPQFKDEKVNPTPTTLKLHYFNLE